jgi:hypothetical protein
MSALSERSRYTLPMRFGTTWMVCGAMALAGCSVVNAPAETTSTGNGGASVGGAGGSGTAGSGNSGNTGNMGNSGGSAGSGNSGNAAGTGGGGGGTNACGDGIQNGDETDVDCGGSCPPCATGRHCLAPADCATGFCPADDHVCCASACDGVCQACAAAKTSSSDGTCAAVSNGTDPDSDCPAGPAANCGSSGHGCNGSGACLLYPQGTVCVPPSCTNGVAISPGQCNGNGGCLPGSQTSCGNYACAPNGQTCGSSCGSSNECVAPAFCDLLPGTCGFTQTFDTYNFAGYTEYPLDADACQCCTATTTAQTANAFCVLAGMGSAVGWTTGTINGTNCYCWDCTSPGAWASNCCGGQADRPMILTVTCQ